MPESKNSALKEVLDHIHREKNLVREQITANKDKVIVPLLQGLKSRVGKDHEEHVTLIEKALEDIASPFADSISKKFATLSSREIEVCAMIKNGLLSKEIADTLGVSLQTVHKFRQRIRQKLNIANDDIDLGVFLRSL
jgi:DNA-binding NarL/FixJ family response regulator